jgi:hypothetical protein
LETPPLNSFLCFDSLAMLRQPVIKTFLAALVVGLTLSTALPLQGVAKASKKNTPAEPATFAFLPPVASLNLYLEEPSGVQWQSIQGASVSPGTAPTDLPSVQLDTSESKAPQTLSGLTKPAATLSAVTQPLSVQQLTSSSATKPESTTTAAASSLSPDPSSLSAEQLRDLVQRSYEETEIKRLWSATIERNPVIRFSLEKLALPSAEACSQHSSQFLKKTLSSLISGAVIGASMLTNAGAYQNMAMMAGGQAVQNMLVGNKEPIYSNLSATEQIQLADLVDDLKRLLVDNYLVYKVSLLQLTEAHTKTLAANQAYAQALRGDQPVKALTTASLYYQAQKQEVALKQKAKLARLNLERLCGDATVASLHTTLLPDQIASLAQVPVAQLMAPVVATTEAPPKSEVASSTATTNNPAATLQGPPEPVLPPPPVATLASEKAIPKLADSTKKASRFSKALAKVKPNNATPANLATTPAPVLTPVVTGVLPTPVSKPQPTVATTVASGPTTPTTSWTKAVEQSQGIASKTPKPSYSLYRPVSASPSSNLLQGPLTETKASSVLPLPVSALQEDEVPQIRTPLRSMTPKALSASQVPVAYPAVSSVTPTKTGTSASGKKWKFNSVSEVRTLFGVPLPDEATPTPSTALPSPHSS